jgi:hypothetical protein
MAEQPTIESIPADQVLHLTPCLAECRCGRTLGLIIAAVGERSEVQVVFCGPPGEAEAAMAQALDRLAAFARGQGMATLGPGSAT